MAEIEEKITADLSVSGRSRASHPLNELLKSLQESYDKLGGDVPRANGRSRRVGTVFADPGRRTA